MRSLLSFQRKYLSSNHLRQNPADLHTIRLRQLTPELIQRNVMRAPCSVVVPLSLWCICLLHDCLREIAGTAVLAPTKQESRSYPRTLSLHRPNFRGSFDAEFEGLLDVAHVQHAFKQLAPGGRLVAVMGAGAFFRTDKKAVEFRAWLEELSGDVEELPENAFKGVEAFRQTGVQTKLVFLSRPS